VLARHGDYRIFWTGQTLSLIGSWMQTMAVGWLSLQLSNSALVVGLVASAAAIPVVLLSMHAGALVDHGNKLRWVRLTQSVFLAQALVLWGITATGLVSIPAEVISLEDLANVSRLLAAFIVRVKDDTDFTP